MDVSVEKTGMLELDIMKLLTEIRGTWCMLGLQPDFGKSYIPDKMAVKMVKQGIAFEIALPVNS